MPLARNAARYVVLLCLASLLLLESVCEAAMFTSTNRASSGISPKSSSPKPKKPKHAKLKISGYGPLGDLRLKNTVRLLVLNRKKPPFFDTTFVEDASLILASTLRQEGYLEPSIVAELTLEEGNQLKYKWDESGLASLPRSLRILKARFRIHKGVLYHYQQIRFTGLKSLTEKEARSYFVETGVLLSLKPYRIYTPEKLRRSLENLTDVLERQGYEEARASIRFLGRDNNSGAVQVEIEVTEGRKSMVRSVRQELLFSGETTQVRTVFPKKPYSRLWEQDAIQALKTNAYHRGYPDTTVEVKRLQEQTTHNIRELDLLMTVRSGEKVRLGKLEFRGEQTTRESLMRARVRLKEGSLLDRIKAEQGRYRLVQLGIFDSVDLSYHAEDEHVREVTYRVKESKKADFSLLLGFGSYELLRGGIELERRNVLGLAHDARLKLVQSFKASSAEFYYTMPDLVGHDVDVFLNATALRREEVSFLREEYGGGIGAHKYFRSLSSDVSVRYNYQILNAAQASGIPATEGVLNPAVGAIITDLKHDRRDNPLYPHRGYKVFANIESGTPALGGNVNYERVEVSSSFHQRLGGGRWLHLGLSHGAAISFGSSSNNLPFNRRFFPGGQNSIRGYQEGKASPRDAQGDYVGAESYVLGSVEFEQAITPRWSLVLFSDSLGEARRIEHYPMDMALYSVGGGLNWRTIVGPVRLEYGHNLNRRQGDPFGTLHFSFGFPF